MYMLFVFGREVERFIGRQRVHHSLRAALAAPDAVSDLWGLSGRIGYGWVRPRCISEFSSPSPTIYPSRRNVLLRIQVKWIALAFGVISIAALLAAQWPGHDWARCRSEATVLTAFLFIRMRGIGPELEWWTGVKEKFQPKPKFQVVPRSTPRRVVEPENVYESIDPLLDKISKSGINSLTASERRTLDRARNQLLKKSQ